MITNKSKYGNILAILLACLLFSACKKETDVTTDVEAPKSKLTERTDNPVGGGSVDGTISEDQKIDLVNNNDKRKESYQLRFNMTVAQADRLITKETKLGELLEKLPTDRNAGNESLKVLKSVCETFKKPLESAQSSDVISPEFERYFVDGKPTAAFLEKLDEASFSWISKEDVFDLRALLATTHSLSRDRPRLLMEFLNDQSDRSDQQRSDLFLFEILKESFLENSDSFRAVGYDEIRDLGTSKNPIYRLLGIKIMSTLERDPVLLQQYFNQYIEEKNSSILAAVIGGLSALDTKEAVHMIESIGNTAVTRGDSKLKKASEAALQTVKLRESVQE